MTDTCTSDLAADRSIPRARNGVVLGLLMMALGGCGISYTSPSVIERVDDVPVTVIELNPQVVARANATSYTPQTLPEVFDTAAGTGGSAIGLGALPAEPHLPTETRQTIEYRPLPDVQPDPYRIGVGDVLLLATQSTGSTVEQLSGLLAAQNQRQGYTVRDDGAIAIPQIGTVQLGGLTLQEAEDRLFQVLVENQIDPSFSLEVADFNSKKVAVGGAVGQPTLVPITLQPLTLGNALVAAGGVTVRDEEFASIRIYRDGTLYQIPVERYLAQPELQEKILVNGDAVYVDLSYDLDRALAFYQAQIDVISLRSSARQATLAALTGEINLRRQALEERRSLFERRLELGAMDLDYVYLTGEVTDQGRFPLPFNHTASLADVLYGEGGFSTATGDPAHIYVLRGERERDMTTRIVAYRLNAHNAADLIYATDFEMRPDDVVFIEEQPITKWNRALQQFFPVLLQSAQTAI